MELHFLLQHGDLGEILFGMAGDGGRGNEQQLSETDATNVQKTMGKQVEHDGKTSGKRGKKHQKRISNRGLLGSRAIRKYAEDTQTKAAEGFFSWR